MYQKNFNILYLFTNKKILKKVMYMIVLKPLSPFCTYALCTSHSRSATTKRENRRDAIISLAFCVSSEKNKKNHLLRTNLELISLQVHVARRKKHITVWS
uniref:Uncharacterized protein n=1 Tax=Cacopsylla melanoneura TaxID=428564 RepID=A0A8D8YRF0_9HEMI